MLSVDTAAQYLLDHGLITPQAILTGDLTITSAARRNRNLRVTQRAGRSYLIKQPDDPSFGGGISLRCEAAFYSFCRQDPDLTPIQALLPQLLYLDNDQAVLALELLNDVQPLWDYCNQFTAALFPNPVVHAVGHAIGSIHHLLPASARRGRSAARLAAPRGTLDLAGSQAQSRSARRDQPRQLPDPPDYPNTRTAQRPPRQRACPLAPADAHPQRYQIRQHPRLPPRRGRACRSRDSLGRLGVGASRRSGLGCRQECYKTLCFSGSFRCPI